MEGFENHKKEYNERLTDEETQKVVDEFDGDVWVDGEYFVYQTARGEGRLHRWVRIPYKTNENGEEKVVGIPIIEFLHKELS
ncbi:hypothetical protein CL631_00670 [bacterium]|jgi:hypothetical protein|nr:hypothetical protein [bacterium]MDP6659447.1 hypothetical protein [Candidatus Paceibacterota bacterium]|tara:strand:- start:6034 stop:6279 length:246 start_codon:yes stop_codon:yes gene_type:complete